MSFFFKHPRASFFLLTCYLSDRLSWGLGGLTFPSSLALGSQGAEAAFSAGGMEGCEGLWPFPAQKLVSGSCAH